MNSAEHHPPPAYALVYATPQESQRIHQAHKQFSKLRSLKVFFFFLRRGFAIKDVSIFIQPEEKKKKKPRRNHWHIAGKGLIALIYKELLPINKREAFIKKTMDKR